MICPNCRQDAPTVARGVRAYCTACGAPRSLIEATPVNVAGQPSKIGGGVASVAGISVLVLGLLFATALGGLISIFAPTAGLIVGGFIAAVCLFVSAMLLWGGRELRKSGSESEQHAREQAIFAMARQRGGSITAAELARALSLPEAEADGILTNLAKRPDGRVTLEFDDNGALRYDVHEIGKQRVRVSERKRVAPEVTGPNTVLDAEFEEQAEEEARAAEKRARR